MYYTIYKTTCLINGKIYVGKHQTKNLNDGYLGSGKSLLHAINKYGKENFKVERIFLNSEEEMNELEAFIVDEEFVSRKDTYNITLGGLGGFFYINSSGIEKFKGKKHSQKTKQKLAMINKGRRHPQETIQKMIKNRDPNCPIRRDKISKALKNKKKSEEHKQKISKALIGNSYRSGGRKVEGIENLEIIKLWHPTKNSNLNPLNLTCNRNTKIWWLCKNNHSYEKTIRAQIKSSLCPICNSMGFLFPKIAKLWHPTKNGDLTPFKIAKSSKKKVWWICDYGHEYEQRIDDKTLKGYGCPKCAGRK